MGRRPRGRRGSPSRLPRRGGRHGARGDSARRQGPGRRRLLRGARRGANGRERAPRRPLSAGPGAARARGRARARGGRRGGAARRDPGGREAAARAGRGAGRRALGGRGLAGGGGLPRGGPPTSGRGGRRRRERVPSGARGAAAAAARQHGGPGGRAGRCQLPDGDGEEQGHAGRPRQQEDRPARAQVRPPGPAPLPPRPPPPLPRGRQRPPASGRVGALRGCLRPATPGSRRCRRASPYPALEGGVGGLLGDSGRERLEVPRAPRGSAPASGFGMWVPLRGTRSVAVPPSCPTPVSANLIPLVPPAPLLCFRPSPSFGPLCPVPVAPRCSIWSLLPAVPLSNSVLSSAPSWAP